MKGTELKPHQEILRNYRQIRVCGDLVEGAVFPGNHQGGDNSMKTQIYKCNIDKCAHVHWMKLWIWRMDSYK